MIIIGNGEIRSSIDISKLGFAKIGCNAIHRDFKVDSLVCVDKRMVSEAVQSKYHKSSTIYTSKEQWILLRLEENVKPVPDLPYTGDKKWDQPRNWGSGPYAVLIGAQSKHETIRLLGFDLYSKDKQVNNIYKNTSNYATTESRAVDPRYWIYQISKVFELYSHKQFIVYNTREWVLPESWKKSNVTVDSISNI
jgi:hypothetical protein